MAEIGQKAVETGHSVSPMPGADLACSSPLTCMAESTTRLTYNRLDIAGLFKEETAWLLLPQNQMLLNIRIGTYPYHTSTNGLVERFMQTFKVALWQRKMASHSHTAWLVYCMHLIIADYYY